MVWTPSEEEKEKLRQWIPEGQQWISIEAAIELIKTSFKASPGYARKLWMDARTSGEVPPANDDGIVKDPRFDYAVRKDDLVGWISRHPDLPGKPAPAPRKSPGRKPKSSPKEDLAQKAIKALWPGGVPPVTELSHPSLCSSVWEWLKNAPKGDVPGKDAILRAAGRRK
jgi:hypothetical protein